MRFCADFQSLAGRRLPVSVPGSAGGSWEPPRLPSAAGTGGPRFWAPHIPRESQVPAPSLCPFGHRGTFNLATLPLIRAENGGSGSDPGCGARSCAAPELRGASPFPAPGAGVSHLPTAGKRTPSIFYSFSFPHFPPSPTQNPRRKPGESACGR